MASAGAPSSPSEGRAPRRGRVARWRRRFLLGSAVVFLLGGAAAFLSWHHRLRLLNDWLADLNLPIRVQAGALDWEPGAIRLQNVTLRSRSGEELGRVRRADISISVRSARQSRVEAVSIEGLRFTSSPEQWRALIASAPDEASESGSSSAWQIDTLSFADAAVEVAPTNGSRMQASFDWEGGAVAFTPSGGLRLNPQEVKIHRLDMRAGDGGAAEMTNGVIEWSLDPATKTIAFVSATWSGGTLELTPQILDFFSPESPPAASPSAAAPVAAASAEPPWAVVVEEAALGFDHFAWQFPGQIEVSAKGTIKGKNFRWDGDWSTDGHRIELAAVQVTPPGGGGASRIEVASALGQLSRVRGEAAVFDTLDFTGPSVHLAAELWGAPATAAAAVPAGPSTAAVRPLILIKSGRLSNGALDMVGVAASVPTQDRPSVRVGLAARAEGLTIFSNGHVSSSSPQSLIAEKAEVAYPGEQPLLQFGKLAVEMVPDEVASKKRLSSVEWVGAEIRVDDHALKHFGSAAGPSAAPGTVTSPSPAVVSWWHGLIVTQLTVPDAKVTITDMGAGVPNVSGRVAVATHATDGSYRAVVADLAAVATTLPETTVLKASEITLTAHPSRLWERRLDGLVVSGAELLVGPALQSLGSASPDPPEAAPETVTAPPQPAQPGWHLGRFSLENSRVEISNLVPYLDPVTFPIAFQLENVPLSADGLRAQEASQRIELSHLRLNSAYGSTGSLSVAELDHLFVEFSLAGLLDQRLDRVEVIGPTIYVGEQLFWYVDYFRKYAAGDALPADDGEGSKVAPATTGQGSVESAVAAERPPVDQPATPKGWSVLKIDAYYGKFVLALKGSIIDALPALPFSCSTQLDRGRVDLTLDIPRDTYRPSTRLPLEIDVQEGTAAFNLPIKQQDNNLVQVFKASELRYKEFKAQDVFLSMTYDRYGVYARFGGKLYGGYLSGGGDLYLDDNTSWDGWLDGENIDLGPLTSALTPTYLSLTGVSRFNVRSFGDLESLYTATGSIATTTPGQMTVHALTPLKEDLPTVWSQLQRSLTERGVETLRDFPYDQCQGQFKLFRQEGDLTLKLAGPLGKRHFDISLHDHRGAATDPKP